MAKKTVHHMDFDALLAVNKEVVLLTGESHEFSKADGDKLKELLAEVETRASNQSFPDAVTDKAAFLVFKLAAGQHFKGGNKRTALVAGLVFLRKNGFKLDVSDAAFVSVVDKVGIAAASLDDLYTEMERLVKKSTANRKSWEALTKDTVTSNLAFLTDVGS